MRGLGVALAVCALLAPVAASPQSQLAKIFGRSKSVSPANEPRRGLEDVLEMELTPEEEEAAAEKLAEEEKDATFKLTCVLGLLSLGGTFIVGYMLELKHIHRLPEAGVGLIFGMILSAAAYAAGNIDMLSDEQFDFEFFIIWLLPPIIFEAGFNMNSGAFFANIGPTIFFAFIGTFASTFVVGGIVYYAGQLGLCYPLGMLSALVFGSLISATDPVTVLAVFQALGVKVDLFSMVFGESVLNDAVAIVLSRTLLSFNSPKAEVNFASVMDACVLFATIFVGSMLIGLVYGVASALVYKKLNLRDHEDMIFMETALSMVFPFAAYFTAESLHLSGIVTIMFCGIIMAQYTRNNFSPAAVQLTAQAYKVVALIAETFVFVYLGMAAFSFPIFKLSRFPLLLVSLAACFVGRLHIYVGSWLTNCMRTTDGKTLPPISSVYQFVMWFSGLRGGVAFALASVSYADGDFPDVCGGFARDSERLAKAIEAGTCQEGMNDSLAVLQTTLFIACFTIFVFGGAITEVAIACKVLAPKEGSRLAKKEAAKVVEENDKSCWFTFNRDYIQPALCFSGVVEKEEGVRFGPAVEKFADGIPEAAKPQLSSAVSDWSKAGRGALMAVRMNAKEIKESLSAAQLDEALKGSGMGIREAKMEDLIDEVRMKLPTCSTDQCKKLLEDAKGDVDAAVRMAPKRGGGAMEML